MPNDIGTNGNGVGELCPFHQEAGAGRKKDKARLMAWMSV